MKLLNTTAKGDLFEQQIFDLVKEALENDEFFVNSKRSKVFWKKGYYSEARKKDIIFDISIETYLENAKTYSTLTIIECKNYKGSVPVDDIEELDSKLSQVGEHNTKGIILSKTPFQSGALDFANSKKIGLGIINSKNKLDWISYRKDRNKFNYDFEIAESFLLTNDNDNNFFVYVNNESFENLPDLLINLGIIDKYIPKRTHLFFPYKTEEQFEELINQLPTDELYKNGKLNTDKLCDFLSAIFDLEFIFNEDLNFHKKNKVLGKILFNPLKIYITKDLSLDRHRWRFTLAHEIGHLLLHYEILKDYLDDNIDTENSTAIVGEFPDDINRRMEIQANMFASILLLPKSSLLIDTAKYFVKESINKSYLYLDSQRCNQILVYNLLNRIRFNYGVSNEAAKYRLVSLDLLKIENMTSIKDILLSQ